MPMETAATYTVNGHEIDVVRQIDDQGNFYCYDLFRAVQGDCLNEGDPWFEGEGSATPEAPPTEDEVREYLEKKWQEETEPYG